MVLRAAGTNCDAETAYAFEKAGAEVESVHVNRLADGRRRLCDFQILAIPGGFTYGDDVAAGRVLANEMRHRLGDQLREFVDSDRLVLGICNGFQVLVKLGLLPGWEDKPDTATLTFNDSNKFEDRWVHLKVVSTATPFLRREEILYLPVAHGEGKFVVDSQSTLDRLRQSNQVIVEYCSADGGAASYPDNPNGSIDGIAGICGPSGRVFALMPHPERNVEPYHHPRWTRGAIGGQPDGMRFFINALDYFS
jgi:phosphoribosylformylglycinamidine synthase